MQGVLPGSPAQLLPLIAGQRRTSKKQEPGRAIAEAFPLLWAMLRLT